MQTDRFQVKVQVLPKLAWHGSQADHLQAMVESDEVIRHRVHELAERAKQGRKPTSQEGQEGRHNLAQVSQYPPI